MDDITKEKLPNLNTNINFSYTKSTYSTYIQTNNR